jgi:hypothetical protein
MRRVEYGVVNAVTERLQSGSDALPCSPFVVKEKVAYILKEDYGRRTSVDESSQVEEQEAVFVIREAVRTTEAVLRRNARP